MIRNDCCMSASFLYIPRLYADITTWNTCWTRYKPANEIKWNHNPRLQTGLGEGGGDYKGILIQTSAGFFRLPNNFSLLALHTKLKGSSWHSKFKKKRYIILEWHASLVVVTLASQHEGLGVTFTGQLVSFCVESAYTPHALRVHRLPPTVQRRLVCGVNWWL